MQPREEINGEHLKKKRKILLPKGLELEKAEPNAAQSFEPNQNDAMFPTGAWLEKMKLHCSGTEPNMHSRAKEIK